ncbi:MAG: CopG family transcriptional regulator [Acidimicrobiales bacterium]
MTERTYGYTKDGQPITDATVEELADQADLGYRKGELAGKRRGPGRPPLGDAAKPVGSVRLEPELRAAVQERARREGVSASEIVRRALRKYLRSA